MPSSPARRPRRPRHPLHAGVLFVSLAATLSLVGACATGGTVETGGTGAGGSGGERPAGSGGSGGTTGSAGSGGSTTTTTVSTSGSGGSGAGGGLTESACPPGSYATGLDFANKLVCAPLSPEARDAINEGCSIYLGWRDACTGCDLEPAKWGRAWAKGCENGVGADDTCSAPTLDGVAVQLFGLSPDGDVNQDDKLYMGFHCPAAAGTAVDGPCEPGSYATALPGDGTSKCVPAAAPVLDHVRARCSLYFGWRDSCDGCTSAPDRWGRIGPSGCTIGAGDTGTCTTPMLGGEAVQTFGLNPGGDVDGNDKLYVALHCEAPQAASTKTKGACPAGQLITSVAADGTLTCESPAEVVAAYFDEHCTAYFGWRDGCNACTDAPTKWGRLRDDFCTNDSGVDNTCTETILGGATLSMFGLNTDGDVNGDDKLYVGLRCD